MYGFKRLSHGMDKGGYYHDMFLQNFPAMAKKIQRQKIKGMGPRRPAQPDQEPNFYAMPSLLPENLVARPLQGFATNNCYSKPGPITLRSSLVLSANHISLRGMPPRSAAQPLRSVDHSAAALTEPLSILPTSGSTLRYDEEDMDALTQLASWF